MMRNLQHKNNDCSGFTLVEMAVVIIISGLMIAPLFSLYIQEKKQSQIRVTRENIKELGALATYFKSSMGRYPCPAEGDVDPGDNRYGREINAACNPGLESVSAGTCDMGNGFCFMPGARDLDGDLVNEMVITGTFPIVTVMEVLSTAAGDIAINGLNGTPYLNAKTGAPARGSGINVRRIVEKDGWDGRMTYSVTHQQATEFYEEGRGAIAAVNEFGQPTAGINNDADFAIVSHGANQVGAFMESGQRAAPCGILLNGLDNENCIENSVTDTTTGLRFVNALHSSEAGANRFDDFTYFGRSGSTQIWVDIFGTSDIRNTNSRNVGVGTATPATKLDVAGGIKNDKTTRVKRVCSLTNPTECFNVSEIAEEGRIQCEQSHPNRINSVMQGIKNIDVPLGNPRSDIVKCVAAPFSNLKPNQQCQGLNNWIVGVTNDGDLICTNGSPVIL